MLAGGGCVAGGRIPAKPLWSEVMIFLAVFLRQRTPLPEEIANSDKEGAHRRTDLRRVAHLRGENVSRRRMRCGGPNSGEAAVVGGDRLSGSSPPATIPLIGGRRPHTLHSRY